MKVKYTVTEPVEKEVEVDTIRLACVGMLYWLIDLPNNISLFWSGESWTDRSTGIEYYRTIDDALKEYVNANFNVPIQISEYVKEFILGH